MQLIKTIIDSAKTDGCAHEETASTVSHGLERTVCQACGNVAIETTGLSQPGALFQARS